MKESIHALALEVKYHGPTSSRGSRVKISCRRTGKSKTFSYDYSARSAVNQAEKMLNEAGIECQNILDMGGHYILVVAWSNYDAVNQFLGGK